MQESTDTGNPSWWHGTRGEWYVIAQFVLFALIAFGPRSWPDAAEWNEPYSVIASALGILLMLAGMALATVGLLALGPTNLTALPYPRDSANLIRSGPYALVRHPIYGGLLLGAFGWALYLNAWLTLLFAALLFALFDVKSRREERWLIERFPTYADYCRRTKRFVPWVY